MQEGTSPIIVLGIGNILQRDEGVGVRVIQELMETFDFPDTVELVDGGVLGLSLLSVIERAKRLIVVDAVRLGGAPGDLFRVPWEELPNRTRYKDSLHQVDFIETMTLMPLIGQRPPTVLLGVEPQDITTWSLDLSPTVAASLPGLCRLVLKEIENLGVEPRQKEHRTDVFGRTR